KIPDSLVLYWQVGLDLFYQLPGVPEVAFLLRLLDGLICLLLRIISPPVVMLRGGPSPLELCREIGLRLLLRLVELPQQFVKVRFRPWFICLHSRRCRSLVRHGLLIGRHGIARRQIVIRNFVRHISPQKPQCFLRHSASSASDIRPKFLASSATLRCSRSLSRARCMSIAIACCSRNTRSFSSRMAAWVAFSCSRPGLAGSFLSVT